MFRRARRSVPDPESYHSVPGGPCREAVQRRHDRIKGVASTTPSLTADAITGRLADIAAAVGTPCYVYDADLMRAAYAALDNAFDGYPHAIHYALKANSSLAVVRLLHSLGSHGDANSLG